MRLVFRAQSQCPKAIPQICSMLRKSVLFPWGDPWHELGNLESGALLSALHGTSDVLNLPHLA